MGKLVIDYKWKFKDGIYSIKNKELSIHGFDYSPEGAVSMFLSSLSSQWDALVDCPIEELCRGHTREVRKSLRKKFKECKDAKT